MTVKDLKKILRGLPDDMQVLVPIEMEFTGAFFSPCNEESGELELGMDEDSDETEKSFCLVPCGFFQPHEGPPAELN